MKPRITADQVVGHPEWARALYLQGAPPQAEIERGRRHLIGTGLRTTRASTRESSMSTPTATRCVCAAGLERAREQYGHILVDRGDPDLSRIAHIDDILDVMTEEEKQRRRRC